MRNGGHVTTSRVSHVRRIMGLPPATPEMLWLGMEAASDDMAAAFRFIENSASDLSVDPARIAVGGFSAGARTALNAAFGEGIRAAAVISLSGFMAPADLDRLVTGRSGDPPALLVSGEHDLDYVQAAQPGLIAHFDRTGVPAKALTISGAGHFYAADTATTTGQTLRAEILSFLLDKLGQATGGPQGSSKKARTR